MTQSTHRRGALAAIFLAGVLVAPALAQDSTGAGGLPPSTPPALANRLNASGMTPVPGARPVQGINIPIPKPAPANQPAQRTDNAPERN